MKRILRTIVTFVLIIAGSSVNAQNEYLVDSEFLNNTPSFLLGLVPAIPATYDVDFYRLTYYTTDVMGNETVASGSIALPSNSECNSVPMAVYCHGTVLRQNDVPSQDNIEGFLTKVLASSGYIAVAPDYLGLGENPGFHPYVHAESQATATIDLIRAAREFLETSTISDNGETLITGYSQGGHAAMATLKYATDENLNEELGIVAGAPCSGPYNISDTQTDVILSGEPYSNPGYIVYVVMSYEFVYGNIYENLSDVIQQPYADEVVPYFDGMQDENDMGVVNALLPGNVDELLVDSVLENFENNLNHPLRVALRDNDNYDWAPQVPLRMFYCTGDEQVSFMNSIDAEEAMLQNGVEDVASINSMPETSHADCVFPALTDAFEFFTEIAPPCAVLNTRTEKPLELNVYPNPTQGLVNLSIDQRKGKLAVQDMSGRILTLSNISSETTQIDLSDLPSGVYLISVQTENQLYRSRIVIE